MANLRSAFHLDLGESEAILVAEALGNAPVLMDERRGVRCARSRGLVVIRTPLIYAGAKIGARFFAHAHSVVREFCILGDDVTLENGVIIVPPPDSEEVRK